jgi:hypothetical protein
MGRRRTRINADGTKNCANRRSSAFIGGQIPAFRIQLKACKQMVNTSAQFPERDVASSLWIKPPANV